MKKIVLALAGAALLAAALSGCSNSSDGVSAGFVPTGGTSTGTGGGGNPTDADTVLIGASNLVYIGEEKETLDAIEYTVKKYADVYVDNPYFYTYYKLYYLNGKLRRYYQFGHGVGSEMDYKYTEFVEHDCGRYYMRDGGHSRPIIYTYYENGKMESNLNPMVAGQDWIEHYYYYNNGNLKLFTFYIDDELDNFYYRYASGYVKYFYSDGYFYTFDDGKITTASLNFNPDSSDYTNKEAYTPEQAAAKLEELKNN